MCQCPRLPGYPCKRRASQEDLLCDVCRRGCVAVRDGGGVIGGHLGATG
jgi:hypothetical protein